MDAAADEILDAAAYARIYRDMLLKDVIPFWMEHSPDRKHGGCYTFLARDGSVYRTDKAVRVVARVAWVFSRLYNQVESRPEWLDLARLGCEFLMRHGFDENGRAYFLLAEDGTPLARKSRPHDNYVTAAAFLEYARASGDEEARGLARRQLRSIVDNLSDSGSLRPEDMADVENAPSFRDMMLLHGFSRGLAALESDPCHEELVARAADALRSHLATVEERALLGTAFLWKGQPGRFHTSTIVPGGVADRAAGLMLWGRERQAPAFIKAGAQAVDFLLAVGWDLAEGGLFRIVSAETEEPVGPDGDLKVSWAHCEALRATLLAYRLTGERRYLDWFKVVHDWTFSHFPDPEFGAWFDTLNRDGTPADDNKGDEPKELYHLSKMLLRCWRLMEELEREQTD